MSKSLNKFLKAMRVAGLPLSRKSKEADAVRVSSTLYLPIELWLQIFDHIDEHHLISLTQVNRALCEVAEAVLYHTVTLRWEAEVTKFLESTRSRPRRAGYVVSITLVDIDKSDEHIHDVLPSLLNSLPHLQFLRVEEIPGEGIACCTAISRARLPQLRTLVAGMRSSPGALLDFLAAHENLQEVDLRYTFVVDEPSSRPIEGTVSPAVRTLTCRTPFLNCRPPIPSNLTHLYRPSFLLPQLPLLALHAGPQLVSLRLGSIFPLDRFRPWSLLDVVSRFPRLRFLQVDMIATVTPGLDTRIIDWYQERSSRPDRDSGLGGRARITLAWSCADGQNFSLHEDDDVGWDGYLEDGAFHILREWGDCVERVVYGPGASGGPYISAILRTVNGVGQELVKAEDKNMHEDYWKCV